MGRLAARGHRVAVSAFFGLRDARLTVGDIPIYPGDIDGHGNDILELHARDFFGGDHRNGLVLPLTDIWVMQIEVLKRHRVAAWVPVDHEPCQPPTAHTMKKGNVLPIAMSRFGERMLVDEGFKPVYVPHGAETSILKPLDRAASRKAIGLPDEARDSFIVGMVAANKGSRKSFPQAIHAFALFHERHPDSYLYLHTWLGPEHQGLNLRAIIEHYGLKDAICVVDQYAYAIGIYPDEHMAQVYSSLDVLLNPAQGEGFGVPILEAQACGTPVIVTNATAMPELCGSGWMVGGTPVWTSFNSWQLLPDVDELVVALEDCYSLSESERALAREKARQFALGYDADLVTETYWVPALAEIEDRLFKSKGPRRGATVGPPAKPRTKARKK